MPFPTNQYLHHGKSLFGNLFAPLTREIQDPKNNNQLALLFNMTIGGKLFIYSDSQKTHLLLEGQRTTMMGFEWDIFDSEAQNKPLGHIKKNILKTMKQLGAESWDITDPSGNPILMFDRDSEDTAGKRVMDELLGAYYSPTHQYNIYDASQKPVARIWSKHGWWKFSYDMVFEENVGDVERKMAVALFAALTLMLKK